MTTNEKKKLIPQVPSVLENLIALEFLAYCDVCNVHDNHSIVDCFMCKKHLCIDKGRIWKTNGEFVCWDCRLKLAGKGKCILFESQSNK